MGFGLNNPLPSSMSSECRKAGKTLASFVDPRQAFGPDKVIPPEILANAKGLAIITVIKFGFVGSARFGSGIVIARLTDGSWSAPSAIATGGGGLGTQVGLELTDFVFVLNDYTAVRAFAQNATVTLGGNVSIAAGPVGRNAEAAGAASMKGVAGVFSYSKTKGLFAGVSLEGGVLLERRDANEKLYGSRITATQLLEGMVPAPAAADPLLRVLNSRVFGSGTSHSIDDIYNDVPIYDSEHDNVVWEGRRGDGFGEGVRRDRTGSDAPARRQQRAATWNDDVYDRQPTGATRRASTTPARDRALSGAGGGADEYTYRDARPKPTRPTAPKPKFGYGDKKDAALKPNQAVALFAFDADQPGDLGFKKGDVIEIVKKTDSTNDWWTGRVDGKEGIFPSNYVKMD